MADRISTRAKELEEVAAMMNKFYGTETLNNTR
jgi:hypothetical protein